MRITPADLRMISMSALCGLFAWFVLRVVGFWIGAPLETIEEEGMRTGGAIAVLATVWQYIREGEREDERRNKEQ